MKAIFYHADRFGFDVVSPSERLFGAAPEKLNGHVGPSLLVDDCLVVLFHVEEADGEPQIKHLCRDIKKVAEKVGANRLVVAAFGHLSHSYAPMDVGIAHSKQIVETCCDWDGYEVHTSPFGYNKTLILHCKGHPDAIKHRSY